MVRRLLVLGVAGVSCTAAVRGHHERFDGGGYPDGLCGIEIPLMPRLIAIVDCYDALTSPRSYRQALPVARALEFIRAGTGNRFDPLLTQAFLNMVKKERKGL